MSLQNCAFFRKKRERDYEVLVTVTGKKLKLH